MAAWNQKRRDPEMLEERRKKAVRMVFVDRTSKSEAARKVGASRTSVRNWCEAYLDGGKEMDALNSTRHTGRPPRMTGPQLDRLGNILLRGAEHYGYEVDLWTTERVASLIDEKFGVRYHPDHVRKILHGTYFSCRPMVARKPSSGWSLSTKYRLYSTL